MQYLIKIERDIEESRGMPPRPALQAPSLEIGGDIICKVFIEDNNINHILKTDDEAVTLCCDDGVTATFDTNSQIISDIKTDQDLFRGNIINMRGHNLFKILAFDNG